MKKKTNKKSTRKELINIIYKNFYKYRRDLKKNIFIFRRSRIFD